MDVFKSIPMEVYVLISSIIGAFIGCLIGKSITRDCSKKKTSVNSEQKPTYTKSIPALEHELRDKANTQNTVFASSIEDKSLSDVLTAYPEAVIVYDNRKNILNHLVEEQDDNNSGNSISPIDIIKARRLTDITYKYHRQLLGINKPPEKKRLFSAIARVMVNK